MGRVEAEMVVLGGICVKVFINMFSVSYLMVQFGNLLAGESIGCFGLTHYQNGEV